MVYQKLLIFMMGLLCAGIQKKLTILMCCERFCLPY